ncbi:YheU family protein [Cellvibrio sp. QJXJ]|uniref:YheU family protein n=1 Tax=Cellvibrio sp. QJXJ TaxID=2964606 RepID=UPI0021C3C964|nr:YheU family protein [Cellvibrio sp. QJXJ]UUA74103.1 YheU family protein [Cellvibrio sp. QJXJ]
MIIPYEQLSSDALQGLIEEFITRDGTDYGVEEVSLATKVEQVKKLLKRREVVVVFDFSTESASLLTRHDAEFIAQNNTAD